jgi:hypothetical protein
MKFTSALPINRLPLSSHLIPALLLFFGSLGFSFDLSAQTKNATEYKSPNFGCTFEDGPFKAIIQVGHKSKPQKMMEISTSVDIQGCQVIQILFDKIQKDFVAAFKPTDIDDSGNVIIHADRGITYEIHLILP